MFYSGAILPETSVYLVREHTEYILHLCITISLFIAFMQLIFPFNRRPPPNGTYDCPEQ